MRCLRLVALTIPAMIIPQKIDRIKILNRLSFNFTSQTELVAFHNSSCSLVNASNPAVIAPPIKLPMKTKVELMI